MKSKVDNKMLEKIEKGEIRIENGLLVGLCKEPLNLAALDSLAVDISFSEIAEKLREILFNLGSLVTTLYFEGDDISEEIRSGIPSPDDFHLLRLLHEFFDKSQNPIS